MGAGRKGDGRRICRAQRLSSFRHLNSFFVYAPSARHAYILALYAPLIWSARLSREIKSVIFPPSLGPARHQYGNLAGGRYVDILKVSGYRPSPPNSEIRPFFFAIRSR